MAKIHLSNQISHHIMFPLFRFECHHPLHLYFQTVCFRQISWSTFNPVELGESFKFTFHLGTHFVVLSIKASKNWEISSYIWTFFCFNFLYLHFKASLQSSWFVIYSWSRYYLPSFEAFFDVDWITEHVSRSDSNISRCSSCST